MKPRTRTACSVEFDPYAVRAEAARKRLPLYRLAVDAGTNPAALSRALNGRTCPSPELRKKLGEILGITL